VFHSLGASRRRRRHVRLFCAPIRHSDSIGRAYRLSPAGHTVSPSTTRCHVETARRRVP
jgi:hypothetical protein